MPQGAPDNTKKIDHAHPTGWQLFWRTQRECWRRTVTPFLMYLFMSLILLACQSIPNAFGQIGLGVLCIAAGGFYNGHLLYHFGKQHYGAYVAGELQRRSEEAGVLSGTGHRVEQEYRPWKGFYIGLLIGVPVLVFGILAGALYEGIGGETVVPVNGSYSALLLVMCAAWAIMPVLWLRAYAAGFAGTSLYWSLLMVLLPIVVSGIFYIVGAMQERRARTAEAERAAGRKKEPRAPHVQTEAQRRKTLQSKKKK